MEHLVFEGDRQRRLEETATAYREQVWKADWRQLDDLLDFVPPKTPWLGFNHDVIPLGKFADYPKTAGFIEFNLWNGRFWKSHPEFEYLSNDEVGPRVAAFFQSWLYFGLLEGLVGRKIHVSYLMRQDI
jgi:hypothetical protein